MHTHCRRGLCTRTVLVVRLVLGSTGSITMESVHQYSRTRGYQYWVVKKSKKTSKTSKSKKSKKTSKLPKSMKSLKFLKLRVRSWWDPWPTRNGINVVPGGTRGPSGTDPVPGGTRGPPGTEFVCFPVGPVAHPERTLIFKDFKDVIDFKDWLAQTYF